MSGADVADTLVTFAAFALLGALLGTGHFAALWLNVRQYLHPQPRGSAIALPLSLHLGRVLLTTTTFVLIAWFGAAALLVALSGFVAARALAVRSLGRS